MDVVEMEAVLKLMGCRVSGGVRFDGSNQAAYWVVDPRVTEYYKRHLGFSHSRDESIQKAFYELTGAHKDELAG